MQSQTILLILVGILHLSVLDYLTGCLAQVLTRGMEALRAKTGRLIIDLRMDKEFFLPRRIRRVTKILMFFLCTPL
jgi:hypothetical protein